MKYFVANWKANKNVNEMRHWLEEFLKGYRENEDVIVIIAPPFPFLQEIVGIVKNLKNVKVAAQDLSSFEEGSYTGEVTAKSLRGLVDYAIVGHSERRKYFNENDEIIEKKINLANKYQIKTILCIRNKDDKAFSDTEMIAYEPVEAIGTGNNASVDDVLGLKKSLSLNPTTKFLYGGSVKAENVSEYIRSDEIDGLLIGGASLDPADFLKLIPQL